MLLLDKLQHLTQNKQSAMQGLLVTVYKTRLVTCNIGHTFKLSVLCICPKIFNYKTKQMCIIQKVPCSLSLLLYVSARLCHPQEQDLKAAEV